MKNPQSNKQHPETYFKNFHASLLGTFYSLVVLLQGIRLEELETNT